jgi:hypothetical protein
MTGHFHRKGLAETPRQLKVAESGAGTSRSGILQALPVFSSMNSCRSARHKERNFGDP